MLRVHERTGDIDLLVVGLLRLYGSELIGVSSGLMLLLNFHDFFFHFLDLFLEFILFSDLSLDLLSILVFEHLLSSGKGLFFELESSFELFLVHDIVLIFKFLNLVSLLFKGHFLKLNVV
jgi:hypothetical protein